MKIGLLDLDSKIPNLALMKLSTYYKNVFNFQVELTSPLFIENYDMIFASKVFTYTAMPALPEWVNLGESGIDLKSELENPIEHSKPDYSLYPEMDYSLGFTTRGCSRKCQFCIVPNKEGKIRFNADINEFWNPQHKKIILLDNNIFALSGQFHRIADQLLFHNLKVDFNQGLDIRLLTWEKAAILKRLKPISTWRFSWDNLKEKDQIIKGLELLKQYKFRRITTFRHDSIILFYILIGYFEKDYDEAISSALQRIEIINKKYGFEVFAMPYNNNPKYANFARFVNRKAIFYSNITWDQYEYNR